MLNISNFNMLSKYRLQIIISLLIGGLLCVCAEEEDPGLAEVLGEVVVDLLVGFAIGQCQQNPACNSMLSFFVLIFLIIGVGCWCLTGCECEKPSPRNFRRAGTMWVGSRLAYR
jgi:hypothetical protein